MTIQDPTEEEIAFYRPFPSYKAIKHGGNYIFSITVRDKDLYCKMEYNALQVRFISFCERSIEKGDIIGITYKEFYALHDSPCVYCGQLNCGSVDRIDSSRGYASDNVQPVCKICNMMKYTYSHEYFMNQLTKIAKHLQLVKTE